MRLEIQRYLQTRPDLIVFIRENPNWYRLLSRHPEKIYEIEQESKLFYGKTFPQKVERIHQHIQLANLLIGMMQASGSTD